MRRSEFLVVGAGLLGLSTARALARRGREVLLAERQTVGHDRAGSKGAARIFRLGYTNATYVAMAHRSEELWRDLESESGRSLLRTTGQITFGEGLPLLVRAMDEVGAPWTLLGDGEASERYPALQIPGPAVFEPRSGVLAAAECLDALRTVSRVELLENTRVIGLSDDGRGVQVKLDEGEVSASVVVLCCGPWTAPLLGGLGVRCRLSATLEQIAYLAPTTKATVPIVIEWGQPAFYGLPVSVDGLLKVGFHGDGPVVDPDRVDQEADAVLLQRLADASARLLPGYDPGPVSTERCLYDKSPDEDFILDRIGRVVVGAGTSGHGFKFGPLLGEVLADLATLVPPRLDLTPFRLNRSALWENQVLSPD